MILAGAADKPFKETGSVKKNLYTNRKRALKIATEVLACSPEHDELGPFGYSSMCFRNKSN